MFALMNVRSLTTVALAGACVAGLASGTAYADAGGDLFFYPNPSDPAELIVGRYDFDGGTGVVLEEVTEPIIFAEATANWEGGGAPGTDEPGLTTDGSSTNDPDGNNFPFPANTALKATGNVLPVLGVDLAFWNATGPVTFGATPHSVLIESPFSSVPLGLAEEIEFDGDATAPTGTLAPWQSDSAGTEHDHFEFFINEPDATATPGIYLFSLTFEADGASTDPLYFLLGYADGVTLTDENLEIALEDAEGYVESVIIPEPASLMLLAAAGGLALIRRR